MHPMDEYTASEESYKNGYAKGLADALKNAGTLYAIVSGYYSDWAIHGFCTSLQEAYEYCASAPYEYYPVEIKHLARGGREIRSHVYKYRFVFRMRDGSWVPDEYDECLAEIEYGNEAPEKLTPVIRDVPCGWKDIEITVYRKRLGVEYARKAAQDYLYKYLAEKAGVG